MGKINVGLIGCGDISQEHLKTYKSLGLNCVALCDVSRERAEKRQKEFGLEAAAVLDAGLRLRGVAADGRVDAEAAARVEVAFDLERKVVSRVDPEAQSAAGLGLRAEVADEAEAVGGRAQHERRELRPDLEAAYALAGR